MELSISSAILAVAGAEGATRVGGRHTPVSGYGRIIDQGEPITVNFDAMFARLKAGRGTNLVAEILMIVVGINIALWFEGWFEDLEDAETERQYLQGLREDLLVDIDSLDRIVEQNRAKLDALATLVPQLPTLADASPEEQAQAMFEPSGYAFFQPSDFTYRSMQESGDFRLLSSDEIKTGLLRLNRRYRDIDMLQQNFLQALDDEYVPLMMRSFDIAEQRIIDPSLVEQVIFRNFFAYAQQDTRVRLHVSEDARELAAGLVDAIDERLAGR